MATITKDDKVVVLTGAGVSAESGIATFRGKDGLWEDQHFKDIATPEGFELNPRRVWSFYNDRRKALRTVDPNPAHNALAFLEQKLGENFFLITQNVDDLHERAGSHNLVHMHGKLWEVACLVCGAVYEEKEELTELPQCRFCQGKLRPNIVWFGEIPYHLELIKEKIDECTIFISIGTSGLVYPASGFLQLAKAGGAKTYCINPDLDTHHDFIDHFIAQRAGEVLPQLVKRWLGIYPL